MKLRIQKTHPAAQVPEYATDGAACFDLCAILDAPTNIIGSVPQTIRTGLAFEIPDGYAMLIFSRSGAGFKSDTRLANCVGVIDSDYRGEVMVRLTRDQTTKSSPMFVANGDRIAQACLVAVPRVTFEACEQLTLTDRGAGGFGSTGAA